MFGVGTYGTRPFGAPAAVAAGGAVTIVGGVALDGEIALAGIVISSRIVGGTAVETDTARAGLTTPTDTYAQQVLARNPLFYWRFAELGSEMLDYSGHGRSGLAAGTYARAAAVTAQADPYAIDLGPGSVSIADEAALRPTSFTVIAWFTPDTVTGIRPIIGKGTIGFSSTDRTFALWIDNGSLWFEIVGQYPGGSSVVFNGPVNGAIPGYPVAAGQRYQVAITWDTQLSGSSAPSFRVLANGVVKTTSGGSATAFSNPTPGVPIVIGTNQYYTGNDFTTPTTENFDGRIDEVSYYATSLTDAQILADYTAGRDSSGVALGGTAVETDSARAGTVAAGAIVIAGGAAVEGEVALAGSVRLAGSILGGTAVEGEVARAGTVAFAAMVIAGGVTVEGEIALAGTTRFVTLIVGGTALDGEIARPGVVRIASAIAGGRALETDTARAGVVVTAAPPMPGVLTHRWILHDDVSGFTWEMPINPDSMSPLATESKRQMRHGYGMRKDRRIRTMVGPPRATEWSFGGVIRTRAHQDMLAGWARVPNQVTITDHQGRHIKVFFTGYEPADRRPNQRTPWRMRYTMKCYVLEVS